MAAGKDGQTLCHRILPATAGGLTSATAADWHLKVKHTVYNGCLTKNYYITVSMPKISSIHTLIQQMLGSHKLNDHAYFDHALPKISKITFSFPEFAPACKKLVYSIYSFLRYSQF